MAQAQMRQNKKLVFVARKESMARESEGPNSQCTKCSENPHHQWNTDQIPKAQSALKTLTIKTLTEFPMLELLLKAYIHNILITFPRHEVLFGPTS